MRPTFWCTVCDSHDIQIISQSHSHYINYPPINHYNGQSTIDRWFSQLYAKKISLYRRFHSHVWLPESKFQKTYIAISTYIYMHFYIYVCIYISMFTYVYIYIYRKLTNIISIWYPNDILWSAPSHSLPGYSRWLAVSGACGNIYRYIF